MLVGGPANAPAKTSCPASCLPLPAGLPGLSGLHRIIRHVTQCSRTILLSPRYLEPPFLTLLPFLSSTVLAPGGHRVSKLRGKLQQDVGPEREEENVQAVPFGQGRRHLPGGEADALLEERDVQVPDQRGCSRVHGGGHRVPGR